MEKSPKNDSENILKNTSKRRNERKNERKGWEKRDLEYRHLSYKDKIKLQKQRKMFKFLRKLTCWGSAASLIVVLFFVGLTAFYILADSKSITTDEGREDSFKREKNSLKNYEEIDKEFEKSLETDIQNDTENQNENDEEDEGEDKERSQHKNNKNDTSENIEDFSVWNQKCPPELVIVNSKNKLDESYIVDIKVCRGKEIGELAWENLEKMIQAAAKDKIVLWISSGYRSVKYQQKLFNNQVEREQNKGYSLKESEERAQTVVARPGMSEHNTGLAVDFNGVKDDFYKTKEYKWLMDHAADYGFIERYQKKWMKKTGVIYEPWHFRYVGKYAHSIKESNLCLEDWVQQNLSNLDMF